MQSLMKAIFLACAIGIVALPALALEEKAEGPSYSVEINKGTLIRLPSAASSVIVADPTIADVQVVAPNLVYVNGKSVGETSVFAVGGKNQEILRATLVVTHNISKLQRTLKQLYPDAQVDFSSVDGGLVLEGTVDSPLDAENIRQIVAPFLKDKQPLINLLHTKGSDQVNLRVRVAEVQRTQLKHFGINLQSLVSAHGFAFGLLSGRGTLLSSQLSSPGDGNTGGIVRNANDNALSAGLTRGTVDVDSVIDALENQGLVTILAEPNLTALSGKSASFLAGGEFPIPVLSDISTVTIEYKPFGVSLNFTPTVLSKDKISLLVNPEVSQLSDSSVSLNGTSVPIVDTRRATTTVELGSGQSFTIAGLLKSNRSNSISQFPGLGDLPVLGALFRSHAFENDQTELVIIVTPYIVHGVDNPEALADPTQGLGIPSDMERILFGKLYDEYGDNTAGKKVIEEAVDNGTVPKLHGPAGYVLK